MAASLPYTDGRDGNGITDAQELLRYLERQPQRLFHDDFLKSYQLLLRSVRAETLALYDARSSSADGVRVLTAEIYERLWPEVPHVGALVAQREAGVRNSGMISEQRRRLASMLDAPPVRDAAVAVAPHAPETTTAACAACGEMLRKIRRCGRCRAACYCGNACQRTHWQQHKPRCDALVAGGAASR